VTVVVEKTRKGRGGHCGSARKCAAVVHLYSRQLDSFFYYRFLSKLYEIACESERQVTRSYTSPTAGIPP
jgi:hypothetical protein